MGFLFIVCIVLLVSVSFIGGYKFKEFEIEDKRN